MNTLNALSSTPGSVGTSRERASFAAPADLEEFVTQLGRFERGEIDADTWRGYRLLQGTYSQRQEGDVHMVRTKLPQGVVSAEQLEALGEVAEASSRGFGHLSTRQNLQLHFVPGRGAEAALRRLAEVGVTSREACGNAVRNITGCPYSGVSADELFDTTPYAEALTRYFLRHPLSSSLPRKVKIAFEGCAQDHAAASIHDLGFFARLKDGRRGFEVRVGGGTATLVTSARPLGGFVPAEELLGLAEAVLRVFHRLGDRQNRASNRMKFLIRKLGWERFEAEVSGELAKVRAEGIAPLPFDPARPPEEGPPTGARPAAPSPEAIAARVLSQVPRGPGLVPEVRPLLAPPPAAMDAFFRTNVQPQRQPGYAVVTVTVPLGDLTAAQLGVLGQLARSYADGVARLTRGQNVVLRWVPVDEVWALYLRLAAAGLGVAGAGTPADVVSCPGAETCRLAVTHSRGLGRELEAHVRAHPRLSAQAPDLELRVSGCPNGCSQHHVATIGFQGSARKVGDTTIPQYFVLVGGGLSPDGARFGQVAGKIPARRVTQALDRLVALYAAEHAPGEGTAAFFARLPLEKAKAALQGLDVVSPHTLTRDDRVDLGESSEYRTETLEGECAV
jgi:sulfite reductase beta subunit-like hemoprotein